MITMDDLKEWTKSHVTVTDKDQVTLVFDSDVTSDVAVQSLKDYFVGHDKQKAVKLMLGSEELGYFLRADLYVLSPSKTRSIDESAGATMPGRPHGVTFIKLNCPNAGCRQVLLVTRFDVKHPPKCPVHGKAMERRP